jgi:hypothetical protein
MLQLHEKLVNDVINFSTPERPAPHVHSGANGKFSDQNFFLISEHDILDKSMLKNSNLQTVFDFIEPFKSYDDSKNRTLHKIKLSFFFSFSYISAKTKQSKLK